MSIYDKINSWIVNYPRLAKIKRIIAPRSNLIRFKSWVDGVIASIVSPIINFFAKIPLSERTIRAISQKISLTKKIHDNKNKVNYIFNTPNLHTFKRAVTLFSKEPETLEWIDTFNSNDVFYDIGANVGLYTIYAGVNKRAKKIIAFEPESLNYSTLNKNIFLNNLHSFTIGLNIALSDSFILDNLYLAALDEGSSIHNFGAINEYIKKRKIDYKQGCLSLDIDSFIKIFNAPFPNHIKIDVDGLENKIIKGAMNTLSDGRLKSIQIEIDEKSDDNKDIIDTIQSSGLVFKHKKQARLIKAPTGFNYVFIRYK